MAEARALVATWLPMLCGKCAQVVDGTEPWVVGHIKSRASYPALMWEVTNWQPEHRACSDASGQAAVVEKARAEGARAALAGSVFPGVIDDGQPPPLPLSLPSRRTAPLTIRADLGWDNPAQIAPEWMQDLRIVPDDASVPLAMTPPHPEATGSYGPEAVAWIERELKVRYRWWQRLVLYRMLEHRADGTLCWLVILNSASRRSGKSVILRGIAVWRLAHAELLGEVQTIIHTASDLPIAREIQSRVWRWAEGKWGKDCVTKANGKESLEASDGSRWLVRSQSGTVGWDVCLGLADECWDIAPGIIDENLEPAMLERLSPQLLLTSTAHRRATSLMRGRISAALAAEDGETLLLLWGALPQDDPADPATWRKASPHWSEARHKMIANKYAKALVGEDDPEFDDPDPLAGWASQYLNVWRLKERKAQRGEPLVDEDTWADLAAEVPFAAPDAAAIESWFGHGVSLALAWRVEGRAHLSVTDHRTVAGAAQAARAAGYRGRFTVGASLLTDPGLGRDRSSAVKGEARTGAAAADLRRLIAEQVVIHDGNKHLTDQVLGLRTLDGPDGPRMASSARADAVKAAVWAIRAARAGHRAGSTRILTASSSASP